MKRNVNTKKIVFLVTFWLRRPVISGQLGGMEADLVFHALIYSLTADNTARNTIGGQFNSMKKSPPSKRSWPRLVLLFTFHQSGNELPVLR